VPGDIFELALIPVCVVTRDHKHTACATPWISWVPMQSMGTQGIHGYPWHPLVPYPWAPWVPRDSMGTHGLHSYLGVPWVPLESMGHVYPLESMGTHAHWEYNLGV
jgi:hypothetical protein